MKLRRWIPQGPHRATQGLILSEGNKRNRTAPEGPVPRAGSVQQAAATQPRLQEYSEETILLNLNKFLSHTFYIKLLKSQFSEIYF